MAGVTAILDDRPLTGEEATLVRWLLEHGAPEDAEFLPQLKDIRVASRCYCGCASVNFVVGGREPSGGSPLADFAWKDRNGHRFGIFLFARDGVLAGLDVWSIDGAADAKTLPAVDALEPLVNGWGA